MIKPPNINILVVRKSYDNLILASKSCGKSDIWKTPPTKSSDYGEEGWMAYDRDFHYIYTDGQWRRHLLTEFNDF